MGAEVVLVSPRRRAARPPVTALTEVLERDGAVGEEALGTPEHSLGDRTLGYLAPCQKVEVTTT